MKAGIKYVLPFVLLIENLVISCHSKSYPSVNLRDIKIDTSKVLKPLPFQLVNKEREFLFNNGDSSYAYGNTFEMVYTLDTNKDSSNRDNNEWTIYYKNGNIKAKGKYQYSNYHNCCYAGPCTIPYSYKEGKWTYWYESGLKKCEGIYNTDTLIGGNSCGEWVMRFFARIDSSWKFWDEHGNLYSPNAEEIRNMQIADAKVRYAGPYRSNRRIIFLDNNTPKGICLQKNNL